MSFAILTSEYLNRAVRFDILTFIPCYFLLYRPQNPKQLLCSTLKNAQIKCLPGSTELETAAEPAPLYSVPLFMGIGYGVS